MGRADCVRCVVSDAQALPETLKIRGARKAWCCRLSVDAPGTNEQLAATHVVLVLRSGIASVTDLADVQQRALRSAEWRRLTSSGGHKRYSADRVLRAIALAYPESVATLRRELARAPAQAKPAQA